MLVDLLMRLMSQYNSVDLLHVFAFDISGEHPSLSGDVSSPSEAIENWARDSISILHLLHTVTYLTHIT